MNIEPCPFCGSEMTLSTHERLNCQNCCYRCGVLLESVDQHNRLSRIVRAAEAWASARRTGTMLEISETGNELLLAVEGGKE